MKIEIDEGSGFCFGVVTAIRKAEEELRSGDKLYCLGDIVHNSKEVERLSSMGLITIDHEEFARLRHAKVLLRAHGEPPHTYRMAQDNHIEVIDATCPVVLQLQKRIKAEYDTRGDSGKQIVIFGKIGHAEVLGLVGQTNGEAIVIENLEEAKGLDFGRDIVLYSQTTKSVPEFREIENYIASHMQPGADFKAYNTICRQVSHRIEGIRSFASSHEVVFFVSGKKSSNGKVLFHECLSVNARSYQIDRADEIDRNMLQNVASIGICGATSTPKWLMEEVRTHIESLLRD